MKVTLPDSEVEVVNPTLTFTARLGGADKQVEWRLSAVDIRMLKDDPDKWVRLLSRTITRAMHKLVQQSYTP